MPKLKRKTESQRRKDIKQYMQQQRNEAKETTQDNAKDHPSIREEDMNRTAENLKETCGIKIEKAEIKPTTSKVNKKSEENKKSDKIKKSDKNKKEKSKTEPTNSERNKNSDENKKEKSKTEPTNSERIEKQKNVTEIVINENTATGVANTDESKMNINLENYFQYEDKQIKAKKIKKLKKYLNESNRRNYFKEYKQRQRLNFDFRNKEKVIECKLKKEKRENLSYNISERNRETHMKNEKRKANPEYRKIKNEVKAKKFKRMDQNFKDHERQNETPLKRVKRENPEYRKIKNEVKAKKNKRMDQNFKDHEKQNETPLKRIKRENPKYRKIKNEVKAKKNKRMDQNFKDHEKKNETPLKREKRKNLSYNISERNRETPLKRTKRKNLSYNISERNRETPLKRVKRENPEYRKIKNEVNAKKEKRKNSEFKQSENLRESNLKQNKRNLRKVMETEELIMEFHKKIKDGPTISCECCNQLWYKHSVKKSTNLKEINETANICLTDEGNGYICGTCEKYIKKDKIPPCSIINGLKFPDKPKNLELHPLEWRLLSPRIPFMKIYAAPRGKQLKIRGNVVNVPANVTDTVKMLPRATDDTMTIAAQLKRQLKYNHAVMTENIRPYKIMEAAEWLQKNGKLYENEGIIFNQDWLTENEFNETKEIIDSEEEDIVTNENIDNDKKSTNKSSDDEWSEDEDKDNNVGSTKDTLFTAPDFIENNEKEKIHSFAPGEGNIPMSIFMDKNSEELAFPNIFYGNARPTNNEKKTKVYYSEICKSELRRSDRRVANVPENIFFKLKKLQMKIMIGNAQIAVRKNKTQGKKLTVGDLRNPTVVNKLINFDEGYMILKTLRGSPPYFKKAKSDLFAMIRQLGPATFFCSFSAAETHWKHLLRILGKLQDMKDYTDKEIETFNWETKCRLVSSDPVTCTRHFDYQVNLLFKEILKKENSPIGKVVDYFYRVEFQHRGSPHIHTLLWVENAPIYGQSKDEEVCQFIDKVMTCKKETEDENLKRLISYQTHKHSHTCKRKNQKICRFGFPQPPMIKTVILKPFEENTKESEIKKHKENYKKLKEIMDDMIEGEDISFHEFLEKVKLNHDDYILAIKSSVTRPTVFLKRNPNELRINSYNVFIMKAWQANHDIQFVLDVYACAMYIASYIAKSQRGISDVLRKACQEVRNGNYGIKEQVKIIGNKFLNNVEISAQEAVYIILQLPMRKSSREVVFINTSPPEDRVQLLKSKDELENLEDDDENIQSSNLLVRYKNRSLKLEKVCLAEYVAYHDRKNKFIKRSFKTDESGTLKENQDEHNSDDEIEETNEKVRSTPRVIRYVSFNVDKDPEKHYRELLMLYSPWRNEEIDLIGDCETFANKYETDKENILILQQQFENNRVEVEAAMNAEVEPESVWDEQAPGTQQVDKDDEHEENIEIENLKKKKETLNFEYDLGADLGIPKVDKDSEITLYEMPETEYLQLMSSLNEKQVRFVYDTLNIIKTTDTQLFRFLSGGAGVGKSFVTMAIYQSLLRFYSSKAGDDYHTIHQLLIAPTGKAAFNINGNTIHNALKVPINQSLEYKPLDCSRLNTLRTTLGGLKVVFIDEISMVGNAMFNFINKRLQDLKGSSLLFGGIHIIVIGDLFQLKPVFDGYIFEDLNKNYGPLATNLWKDNFEMFELTEIMRQKDSKLFAELLNRLREYNYENEFEKEKDMEVLKSRIIHINKNEYPYNVQHLFISNLKMEKFNASIFEKMTGEKYVIKAKDSAVGSEAKAVGKLLLENIPDDPRKTMQLHTQLSLVVGMKCELCINVRTEDGLTNGADCTIKFIETDKSRLATQTIVWVEFSNQNIGKSTRKDLKANYHSKVMSTWTPIKPISRQIRIGKFKCAELMRTQIPLRPSAAKTIHRSQGDTLDEVVVDFDGRKMAHIHYVGLSRVKTLEGLHIINLAESKIKVSLEVKEEMNSLRNERYLKFLTDDFPVCSERNIVISYQNARSLQKYFEHVKIHPVFINSTVIIISESRLKLKQDGIYDIPGFKLFRNDSTTENDKTLHGMAIYIRTDILNSKNVKVETINSSKVEMSLISMDIETENKIKNLKILGIYKPPKVSVKCLLSALSMVGSKLDQNTYNVILGDFNIQSNSDDCKQIENQFKLFEQKIHVPTTEAGSIIDLIFSNIPEVYTQCNTFENYYSDHKVINITVSSEKIIKIKKKTTNIREQRYHEPITPTKKQKPTPSKSFNTETGKKETKSKPKTKTNPTESSVTTDTIICRGFGYIIKQSDINTLNRREWLNDQIINFYFKILEENEIRLGNNILALDTFFYVRLDTNEENALEMYKAQNLLMYDRILIPIHTGNHWSLVIVYVNSKTIKYFDSIYSFVRGQNIMLKIKNFLERLQDETISSWKTILEKNITIQPNSYDCGVCVCMNSELELNYKSLKEWFDEKLKWNPDEFNGLKVLRVPCHKIWKPDIILYNSAEDYTNGYMQALAMVSHEGKVFWPPIVKFRSTCHIDITYFPFDDQLCYMKFGSWAYDGFQVDVFNRSKPVDLSNFVSNGEWDLLSVNAERHVVKYPCCPEPFPDVTFSIHLRRRTLYYMYNVIVPCIMLSVLTLLVFWMSPDSGEKVTLGLTVLLAFSVFMLLIAENMPATSSFVPLIGIYLTTIMSLTSLSVIMAVVVSNISNNGLREKTIPPFLKYLVLILSKVCCIKLRFVPSSGYQGTIVRRSSKQSNQMLYKGIANNISHDSGCGLIDFENGEPNNARIKERISRRREEKTDSQELNDLLGKVHELMCRESEKDRNEFLCKQWQEIGIVVDRVLFWIFVLGTFMSTIYLLIIMPSTKPDKTT